MQYEGAEKMRIDEEGNLEIVTSIHIFGEKKPFTYQIIKGEKVEIPGTELEFVIMVIAVSCVKLLSAHNSTQHTSRKHKV
jgi:hypothetical protein